MIKGMHHVGISVTDLNKAIEFYVAMLDMEVVATFPFGGPQFSQVMAINDAKGRMGVVRRGTLMLELFEFSNPVPAHKDPNYSLGDRGITHFGIEVADIDTTYTRMTAAGVRFHSPVETFPSGVRATYGRDLDGNVFELLQIPAGSGA